MLESMLGDPARCLRLFVGAVVLAGCGGGPSAAGDETTGADQPEIVADMIVVGGRIVTLDDRYPVVEALAIRDGVVLDVGTRTRIELYRGTSTQVLDIQGGVATPGLTDAHAHLAGLGAQLESVDLRDASSIDEVLRRLGESKSGGEWLLGRGWDQNLWSSELADAEGGPAPVDANGGMPTHHRLSAAFPTRPVWLRRVDGHAAWCNAVVLQRAGIDAATPDPEGGEILRDAAGVPTGVLIDSAMDLVSLPASTPADLRRQLLAAQTHVLARGITGVHEMGVSQAIDAVLRDLETTGELKLRVHGYADRDWFERDLVDSPPTPPPPTRLYALAGVKVYADGALGSRGAAMNEAYSDRPGHRGLLMDDTEAFTSLTKRSLATGWQVAAHAIGDRGNRTVLDAYSLALQRYSRPNHRLRIEHAQIVDPRDIARFAQLGVVASMQPTHATSDMPWVVDRIGERRLAGAYAWRRFLKAGVHLALGSDFPVERAEVTHGLYAAVTRQDPQGMPAEGWLPDQRLTLDEAIAGFTTEAAYAAHREEHLGRLSKGHQADLTIFAEDLWELAPAALREADVRAVVIRGAIAWDSAAGAK